MAKWIMLAALLELASMVPTTPIAKAGMNGVPFFLYAAFNRKS